MARHQRVNRKIHNRLPKAGWPCVNFRWTWVKEKFLQRHLQKKFTPQWFMKMRGANFLQIWIGPLAIVWPVRWLEEPARQLHPAVFED